MRDQLALKPFGLSPLRGFVLFVATLVVTVFAFLFATAPTAHAAPEATWKDGAIVYDGKTFEREEDIKAGSPSGLPAGTKVYSYFKPEDITSDNPRIHLIYFPPNSDPTTLTKATYANYKYVPPDQYTDPQGKVSVTLAEASNAEKDEQTTSCAVDGIGWIICPITNFLTQAMDWLFKIMSTFLTVRPAQTDQETALYRGWAMMRNIANVAFVMAFLIVIYSQVTSMGLSSYGIKRMLPRLIAAAILVNVSYWICAIAIDLSNIMGYSLYDMLSGMRENLTGSETIGDEYTWKNLGSLILSGGTAAVGGGLAVYAAVAAAGGPIYMLLPILLGVIISALVALLIMVARQAIITILVIIAPLAFVAYLLPNTEKYFKKWADLFSTMLLLFPMFSIVLGGAQLAGDAIIASARQGNGDFNLVILGMAVKIAPVVITPFLLKFSGSLLGKIAGVVNNPGKGIIDRSRNFAKERADQHTARALANTKNPGLLARGAQRIDSGRRKRDGWKKANDARRDATWAGSDAYSDIHAYSEDSNRIKQIGENKASEHYANLQQNSATVQGLDIRARASKLDLDVSEAKVEANWEAVKAQGRHVNLVANAAGSPQNVLDAINGSQDASRDLALAGMRKQAAERVQTLQRGTELMDNTATVDGVKLQQFAGGIDPNGAQRALSEALTKQHSARSEAVKNAQAVIEHKNLDDTAIGKLALGDAGSSGIAVTEDVKEAAIKMVAGGKNAGEIDRLLESIDISQTTENHRIALQEALGANSLRPKYITGTALGNIKQGTQMLGTQGLDQLIQKAVEANKLSPSALVEQDPAHLQRVLEAIERDKSAFDAVGLAKLKANILFAKDPTNQLAGKIGDSDKVLDKILSKL